MKRLLPLLIMICILCATGCSNNQSTTKYNDPYNPQAAIEYSYKYAESRNPEYPNIEYNCTNFISQCLIAGGKQTDTVTTQPKEGVRIIYDNDKTKWYCASMQTDPNRWIETSITTSFCRTDDFIRYWSDVRGMEYTVYTNNKNGMAQLYEKASIGDVLFLYNPEGDVAHMCLTVVKEDMKLLVNSNTNDRTDYNVLNITAYEYPRIGLLKME